MSQSNPGYNEVRIPFDKMSFTPDVAATALGANEYNAGINVETDVRGIRSVSGDQEIFDQLPNPYEPIFITGGFRRGGEWWFVVATRYDTGSNPTPQPGKWFACSSAKTWYDITPPGITTTAYQQNTNITETWNGTVMLINDSINAPLFWPDEDPTITTPAQKMKAYSQQQPISIANIQPVTTTTRRITFGSTQTAAPFVVSDNVILSQVVPSSYNSITSNGYVVYPVVACTTTYVDITCSITDSYNSNTATGVVSPEYTWNFNNLWSEVHAGWMRMYQTPNVGTILVAGNLTPTLAGTTDTLKYPVTVRWSQSFGLNEVPITWTPTATNVAQELEVPLRGASVDAFPCNGQFFLCSYWDTVVFSPLNYTTTSAPIIGVKLINQGRGLLSSNCWANTDKMVYGIDARDVWAFDGQNFTGIGNQRVKNWLFDQIDPDYYDRIHMENNSSKYQIEIYYPTKTARDGRPNMMISYRYDLDVWNPPREVYSASFATESPIYSINRDYFYVSSTTLTGGGSGALFSVYVTGTTYNRVVVANPIDAGTGYAIGDTIRILGTKLGGASPANNITVTVTAITSGTGVAAISWTGTAALVYTANLASRCLTYVPGFTDSKMIQKDQGYSFIDNTAITSYFRRDNIKLLKDYSGKLLVHRLLPETVNLDYKGIPLYPSTGSVDIRIEGADSVGQETQSRTAITVAMNTSNPWAQINQNAYRVNAIQVGNSSTTNIWMLNATSWQFTQTEQDV